MARKVARSAITGKFVNNAAAARWPKTTAFEYVGSGTNNAKTVNRSVETGKFVSNASAKRNPDSTISQRV
ncbi:hypothetical protein ARTHROSP310_01340 [Arthrobacter sp. AD-310]